MHRNLFTVYSLATILICSPLCAQTRYQVRHSGPFRIGSASKTILSAEVTRIARTGADCNFKRSDLKVRILNGKGQPLFQDTCADDCNLECNFAVTESRSLSGSTFLLLIEQSLPSAPGTGTQGQYFSLTDKGALLPVTGMVYPSTNKVDPADFRIVSKTILGKAVLCVESREWTGNFSVMCYYPIHTEGTTENRASEWRFANYSVRIDTNDAKKTREHARADSILLYPTPSKINSRPVTVHIHRETSIDFLDAVEDSLFDASVQRNPWWLHVTVDGKVGYIHESDFSTVGLPDAE